jgi:hypothetical protein
MPRSFWLIAFAGLLFIHAPLLPDNSNASASAPIYKYIDDKGVPTFTEQWDGIPERYRSRVESLDPSTMQPFRAGEVVSAGRSAVGSAAASPTQTIPSEPSALSGALDRAGGFRIPLPSRYQFGIGLTTLLLTVMIWMMMRFNGNVLIKFALKIVMILLVTGGMYAMYFSGLNERVAQATGQAAQPSVSGKELLDGVKGTTANLTDTLQKTAIAPLQSTIEKTKEITVGEVSRTVGQANNANQLLQQKLHEIESPITASHHDGQ